MIKIEPLYNDKIIIYTLSGEISPEDALYMKEQSCAIAKKMNGIHGDVTDMRELVKISNGCKDIMTETIKELKQLGLKVTARVFKDRNNPSIRDWQEISTKANYTSNYFTDLDKAIAFVKERLRDTA